MANLPLAFGELLAGGVLIAAGISDPKGSVANVIRGADKGLAGFNTSTSTPPTTGTGSGANASLAPVTAGAAYVNPFPGATASRVDQGVDYTTKHFLAPGNSKILIADPSNAGWKGGGYIAGRFLDGPAAGKVWYMAEGLVPTVLPGMTVAAGQSVAQPTSNPYNFIVGNIEAGLANPASPGQPLAQVATDPRSVALWWNRFVQAHGGPLATDTSSAGYP